MSVNHSGSVVICEGSTCHQPASPPSSVHTSTAVTLFVIILVLTVTENVLTILVLSRDRKRMTVFNLYVISFCAANLLIGAYVIPVDILHTLHPGVYHGIFVCKFTPFVHKTALTATILSLLVVSFYRHKLVALPEWPESRTSTSSTIGVVLVWLVAVVYNIYNVFIFDQIKLSGPNSPHVNQTSVVYKRCGLVDRPVLIYIIWELVDLTCLFVLPLLVAFISYIRVGLTIREELKARQLAQHYNSIDRKGLATMRALSADYKYDRRNKMYRIHLLTCLTTFLVLYYICYTPWTVINLIRDWAPKVVPQLEMGVLQLICRLVSFCFGWISVLAYACWSRSFQGQIYKFIRFCCCCNDNDAQEKISLRSFDRQSGTSGVYFVGKY